MDRAGAVLLADQRQAEIGVEVVAGVQLLGVDHQQRLGDHGLGGRGVGVHG